MKTFGAVLYKRMGAISRFGIRLGSAVREIGEHIYPMRRTIISGTDRREALRHLYAPSFVGLTDVSVLVLNEVKEGVNLRIENFLALQKKATSQIGMAGTLIVIFGAFNHHIAPGWSWGLVPLALAVALSGIALWPSPNRLPEPGAFNFGPTLRTQANKEKIAAALSEAWIDYSLDLQLLTSKKSRIIMAAWILIFLGITVLSIGTLL